MNKNTLMIIILNIIVVSVAFVMINDFKHNPQHWIYTDNEKNIPTTVVITKQVFPIQAYVNTSRLVGVMDYDIARVVPLTQATEQVKTVRTVLAGLLLVVSIMVLYIIKKNFIDDKNKEVKQDGI
jgi:RsiW-degrading membrane proteinase PrsW (M82 family)